MAACDHLCIQAVDGSRTTLISFTFELIILGIAYIRKAEEQDTLWLLRCSEASDSIDGNTRISKPLVCYIPYGALCMHVL